MGRGALAGKDTQAAGMQSPQRAAEAAEAADNAVVAPFAAIGTDEFVAPVTAHPDIRYRFNAAGDVIQKSPTFLHAASHARRLY